jgi:hypothetical protein
MRSFRVGYIALTIIVIFIISLLCLPAIAASAPQPVEMATGRYILYVGKLSQPSPVDALASNLAAASIPAKTIFKGHAVSWKRSIDSAEVDIYATRDLFWIGLALDRIDGTQSFLDDLSKTLASQYALPEPVNLQMTDSISLPISHPDGTIDIAGMQVANYPRPDFYRVVNKHEAAAQYGVPESAVTLEIDNNHAYWVVRTDAGYQKVTAMTYHGQYNGGGEQPKNTVKEPPTPEVTLPPASPDLDNPDHTDYVIMYKTGLSGWDSVISALHTKHSDYQDLTFTTNVSEQLSNLQTIKPDYVIIVIEPTDADPDFIDDVDETMCQIDADEFQDTVWTIITGYDAADALALVNATNASDDRTLVIANPDGSLRLNGNRGQYLTGIITNDDTYLGTATHYVNTSDSSDSDCSADNFEDEIEAPGYDKDCVLFLGHGNTYGWAVREDPLHTGYHDWFYAGRSSLETWENYWGTYYTIDNNQNTFAFGETCLSSRVNGDRATNWSPWESISSNTTGVSTTSIALAWMEDSPGFYAGNDSVSYGTPHVMNVLLNMMKYGYTPARAMQISKNVYHYIIEDETTDDSTADGDGDDMLLYLEREFYGVGDTDWNITIAGDPPDYTINYSSHAQQDQETGNARGYVYVDTNIKWQCTTGLTFDEELVRWPAYTGPDAQYVYEPDSPFTFIPVENGWGNGNSIGWDDNCAVIAGIFKPTSDTTAIEFAGSNPSDATKLYDHQTTSGTTDANEIFKCKENTDELIWIVGAGISDDDSDGYQEWRIDNGYSKSFAVNYWLPGVEQTIGTLTFVDNDTRQKAVSLHNRGSASAADVIAKVPVPWYATNLSVSPSTGISNITTTTDSGKRYGEFTVASFTSDETKNLTLEYDLSVTVDSYNDLDPLTQPTGDVFTHGVDDHTVYIYGTGFTASHEYRVAYYDGDGDRVADDTSVQSDGSGNLDSHHMFADGSDQPGTWHAIVCERAQTPPETYDSDWEYTLTDDTFTVQQSAIPEFPTVLVAIAVLAICAGIYFWLRRKTTPVHA